NRREHCEVDILSVGSLTKVKGFNYLIKACALLKDQGECFRCMIVGNGPEKEHLDKLITQLNLRDVVEIKDSVPHDKVKELYGDAKIFVLPLATIDGASHGIPNVLAEAMAMGLPVISCDVPNIAELIEHDGDGILVREKDAKALAASIEILLLNKEMREDLGKDAREKIEKEFDAKKHIQIFATLFSRNSV
ncbi:MAG: glycosyltransferase, partial [bacterium]